MGFKLAIVTHYPEKEGALTGGVESAAHCLANALRETDGIEISIVSPWKRKKPATEIRAGMKIYWIPALGAPGFLTYWSTVRKAIHDRLRKIEPHIAHFQGLAGWTLGYRGRYILTVHGLAERDVLYAGRTFLPIREKVIATVERAGRKRATDVILINPCLLDSIGTQLKGRLWQIENPVSEEFFKVERAVSAPRILYIGRISRLKNIHGLLRAFGQVRKASPGASLRLAGSCRPAEYQAQCIRLAEELGIADRVHFLGNADRRAVTFELSRASCLALVSFQETAPVVIGEAMAAGVPVVASRICGIPHMVGDRRTGFLVNPDDAGEIARNLIELLENREVNKKMGERCRHEALDRFRASQVAVKTLDVYNRVLQAECPDKPG